MLDKETGMYFRDTPLLIDTGAGEYTSATFGKDRYSIWTMQSAYHNLPVVNGVQLQRPQPARLAWATRPFCSTESRL